LLRQRTFFASIFALKNSSNPFFCTLFACDPPLPSLLDLLQNLVNHRY
jgi:hypothetical protein